MADHMTQIVSIVGSRYMLYQARCSCGFESARYSQIRVAELREGDHLSEVDQAAIDAGEVDPDAQSRR